MRRKIVILCLLTALLSLWSLAVLVQAEQIAVADRLIRFHVVANSDSEADQAQKLALRDALLPEVAALTAGCETRDEALLALQRGLPQLQRAAEALLQSDGCSDPVRLSLQPEAFPRRDYPTFSLPAGRYEALRAVIGEGQGHNWWCVAFPALCLPATTEDLACAAAAAGFSDAQTDLLTGSSIEIELKFKLLDLLQQFFAAK